MAMATLAVAPVAANQGVIPTEVRASDEREVKRKHRAVATGSLAKLIRSRGPAAKPKRHRNRLHTSKRVRRKHRRTA